MILNIILIGLVEKEKSLQKITMEKLSIRSDINCKQSKIMENKYKEDYVKIQKVRHLVDSFIRVIFS